MFKQLNLVHKSQTNVELLNYGILVAAAKGKFAYTTNDRPPRKASACWERSNSKAQLQTDFECLTGKKKVIGF